VLFSVLFSIPEPPVDSVVFPLNKHFIFNLI